MKISAGSVVITAPIGVPLAGNGREDAASRGVHDDLRANIIYLESGGQRLLLIGMDLLGLPRKQCGAIKRSAHAATGIPVENISIMATHTHSGPNTMRIFANFLTEDDLHNCDRYLEWLVETVSAAVPDVVAKAEDGMLGYGHDVVEGFSFCRRIVLKDGSFRMIFEDYDPDDIDHLACPNGNPVMSVFVFTDLQRRVKAVLVHYTSHPAVVCGEDWLYTRDYIHALTVELQKRYGRDTVVLYANGAQGNQVAADPYRPFVTGWAEADRVGSGLAEGAKRIADRILMEKRLKREVEIQAADGSVTLPIRRIAASDVDRAREMLRTAEKRVQLHGLDPMAEATSILEMAEYPEREETVPIQAIRLDEQIIVTFPGEVFLEFAQQVMNSSEKDVMVFGLANDYVGYIPTKEAFSQGGYEVKTSKASSRFAPEAGELLAAACCRLAVQVGA